MKRWAGAHSTTTLDHHHFIFDDDDNNNNGSWYVLEAPSSDLLRWWCSLEADGARPLVREWVDDTHRHCRHTPRQEQEQQVLLHQGTTTTISGNIVINIMTLSRRWRRNYYEGVQTKHHYDSKNHERIRKPLSRTTPAPHNKNHCKSCYYSCCQL